MSKLRIAFESFAESLAYMAIALFTFFCAQFFSDVFPWWSFVVLSVVVCALMAWMNYLGKVYGYGFIEEEEDNE